MFLIYHVSDLTKPCLQNYVTKGLFHLIYLVKFRCSRSYEREKRNFLICHVESCDLVIKAP